jgi:hypothetical protein
MFDLSEPSQLIHLYVFFSKLERDSRGTLTSELRTWELPTETSIKGNKWRSADHSRKRPRTDAWESGNVGNRGGAGGNGGVVDADGFDGGPVDADGFDGGPVDADGIDSGPEDADGFKGDQYMDIIEWRDEVVKGGKEASVQDAPWLQFEGRAIAPLS